MELDKTLILLIIIEIVLAFGLGFTWSLGHTELPSFSCFCSKEECPVAIQYQWKPEYEMMMNEIYDIGYTNNTYDCSNMSWDLTQNLTRKGYDARIMCGWNNTNAHAWVELKLWLDPSSNIIRTQHPKYNQYSYLESTCSESVSKR